jgi:hypothetical protein
MAISTFLNPVDEIYTEEVIPEHLNIQQGLDEDEDETLLPRPTYTIQAAREALKVLIDFTEGRDDVQTVHLRAIERYEQELVLDQNRQIQSTLDSWTA